VGGLLALLRQVYDLQEWANLVAVTTVAAKDYRTTSGSGSLCRASPCTTATTSARGDFDETDYMKRGDDVFLTIMDEGLVIETYLPAMTDEWAFYRRVYRIERYGARGGGGRYDPPDPHRTLRRVPSCRRLPELPGKPVVR